MLKKIFIFAFIIILSSCNVNEDTSVEEINDSQSNVIETSEELDSLLKNSSDENIRVEDGSIITDWTTKGLPNFKKAEETVIDKYLLCEGEKHEVEVTVLSSKNEGPSIYIIAGQHGDEVASYTAINELKDIEIDRGKIYILSPANVLGANSDPKSRYVINKEDLNRSYPGKSDGNLSQRLAEAIYDDIEDKNPKIVLDHHEARRIEKNYDFLGSSLIYTSLNGIEELFLDMHQATQDGNLASEPYNFHSPGPIGSLNNVISTDLGIPVITVETFRGYELERRVEDQLAIVGYVLDYYNIIKN